MEKHKNTYHAPKGSIEYAMRHKTLFQVDGIHKHGQLVTHCGTARAAAGSAARHHGKEGAQLKVWRVTGGGTGCFTLEDPKSYTFTHGKIRSAR